MWKWFQYHCFHTSRSAEGKAFDVRLILPLEGPRYAHWVSQYIKFLYLYFHQCQVRRTSFERYLSKIARQAQSWVKLWKFMTKLDSIKCCSRLSIMRQTRNKPRNHLQERWQSLVYGLDLCIYQGTPRATSQPMAYLDELIYLKQFLRREPWTRKSTMSQEMHPLARTYPDIFSLKIWLHLA